MQPNLPDLRQLLLSTFTTLAVLAHGTAALRAAQTPENTSVASPQAAAAAPTAVAVAAAAPPSPTAPAAAVVPSFRRDVMPVFFRAGCNAGTCHGSARGKDGFMLSLFGFDAAGDYRRTVEEIPGRRINTAVPAESLLLLKATGAVPHTGGRRIERNSELARTLLAWIEAGAPDDVGAVPDVTGISVSQPSLVFDKTDAGENLLVTASYADGSTRDVTALSLFGTNNPGVAEVATDGRVTARGPGDTAVFARFS
ncbi:MAG: hypothetical protein ACKOEO_14450, partial [Planctomycetaceae bacterium]